MKAKPVAEDLSLVDQQLALGVYLEALLREQARGAPVAAPVEAVERPAPVVEAAPPAATVVTRPTPVAAPAVAAAPPAATAPTGVPEWGTAPFQCLLFRVTGITLAVPLIKLYGVLNWPETVTPVFGHAPWFMGLVRSHDQNAQVIDAARLVLPSHHLDLVEKEDRVFGKIILVEEGRLGLACESVAEVITLEPNGVQWRADRGRRPWLAGTVKKHMCALLDADQFAEMIHGRLPREE